MHFDGPIGGKRPKTGGRGGAFINNGNCAKTFATRRFEDFKRAGMNGLGILLDTIGCFTYQFALLDQDSPCFALQSTS